MKTCDFCNAKMDWDASWINIQPRPSDPTELVNTMTACSTCGPQYGFDSPEARDEVIRQIEHGELTVKGGRRDGALVIFHSFA